MKSKFLIFLSLVCVTNLSAQIQLNNFPRVYYPQVYFNKAETEKQLDKGNSSIKGVAFTVDPMNGQTHFAGYGTLVVLFPYTDYFNEWFNLSKKHKNRGNTVYMNPEVFSVRQETITDEYGNFTFNNLKPGKYFIECVINFRAEALSSKQSGTVYGAGYGYAYAVPVYDYYTYQYDAQKKAYKIVDIDKDGKIYDLKLRPVGPSFLIDKEVLTAKTSKINCYKERNMQYGTCYEYHADGKPKIIADWAKEVYDGDYQEYAENEILIAEGKFKKGYKTDLWKYYDKETGQFFASENYVYKNDSSFLEGDVIYYYPSGSVKEVNKYVNGKMNGEMLVYYESGALNIKGMYVNDFLEGIATYYSESGEVIKTEKYLHGKLVK
jgi:antitoxin component YwqK of YwqJK toxin-antitoxin module